MASAYFYRRRPSGKPSVQRRAFFGGKPEAAPFFGPAPVQAKLAFGQPGDRYEQEADAVAERVVQAGPSAPAVQPMCADCEREKGVQRMAEEEEPVQAQAEEEEPVQAQMEEEEPVQAQMEEEEQVQAQMEEEEPVQAQMEEEEPVQAQVEEEEPVQAQMEEEEPVQGKAQGSAPQHFASRLQARQGSGQPLPAPLRAQMEGGIGADFSGVRIHTDGEAQQMSQSIRAHAFTRGRDIYFNAGQYQPQSSAGQRLLAHELTHVVQQGAGGEQVQRKVNYSAPTYQAQDPIPVVLGSTSSRLGETIMTLNGNKLTNKQRAEEAIFNVFNTNLSLSYDPVAKQCKVDTSGIAIQISAFIKMLKDPTADKWLGSYPGSLVSGSPACSKLSAVDIELTSAPSGGESLKKSVDEDEAQHHADILALSRKHIEAFHAYLDGITLSSADGSDCLSKFQAERGDKDLKMAQAFTSELLAANDVYDKPGGDHHYASVTRPGDCKPVRITVNH